MNVLRIFAPKVGEPVDHSVDLAIDRVDVGGHDREVSVDLREPRVNLGEPGIDLREASLHACPQGTHLHSEDLQLGEGCLGHLPSVSRAARSVTWLSTGSDQSLAVAERASVTSAAVESPAWSSRTRVAVRAET